MTDIQIRPLDFDTAQEQRELFNRVFSTSATAEGWKRKHYDNPAKRTPTVFGAFDGEKLVGINAFMPAVYRYNTTTINVVQSCESAVAPEYRGRGIFSKIIRAACDYYSTQGFAYLIGYPNNNSYPGFIKLGFDTVAKCHYCRLITSYSSILHSKRHYIPAWGLFDLPTLPCRSMLKNMAKKGKYKVTRKEFTAYDADYTRMRMVISKDIVQWKVPHAITLSITQGDKNVGTVIAAFESHQGYRRCKLLSIDCCHEALCAALIELWRECDVMFILTANNKECDEYRRLGFNTKHELPFIATRLSDTAPEITEWKCELIDTDTAVDLS